MAFTVVALLVFIISFHDGAAKLILDNMNSPTLPAMLRKGGGILDHDLLKDLTDSFVDESIMDLRRRFRRKLQEYTEQAMAVHGLPPVRGMRVKRDTIEADTLSTSVARKRRNYIGGTSDIIQPNEGVNFVVKRLFQLQEPSFSTLNVTDLNFFIAGHQKYLIAVENLPTGTRTVLYKILKNWEIEELGRIETPDAVLCEVFELEGHIFLLPTTVLAINESTLDGGSGLYRITLNPTFRAVRIQTIDTRNAKAILYWTSYGVDANDGVLCVAPEKEVTPRGDRFSVDISCYRWQGGYFDLTYKLPAHNPQAIHHMRIHTHNYMCVANYKDDTGSTAIHSSIYRYNHKKGRYIPFQKIRTNGARDCKYFKFVSPEQVKEHYLAIANYGRADENGAVDYNVKSYIFKFAFGRFIFFQSLVTFGAFQILPIQTPSTYVLIIGEMHRLSVYQHNGWSFVKTRHIDFPDENLANQFRMRPILNGNDTYFTVATPKLPKSTGIYGIEFEAKNDYSAVSSDFEEWCVQALETVQAVNLTELARRASSVPNVTTPHIVLTSPLVFTNIRAPTLKTRSLDLGDAKFDADRSKSLAALEHGLHSLEKQTSELKDRIDNSVTLNGDQVITARVHFSEWSVSNETEVGTRDFNTTVLNDINVTIKFSNLIFLDQNYQLAKLRLGFLEVRSTLHLRSINNVSLEDFALKNSTKAQKLLESNTFQSLVRAKLGFNLTGFLNGVNVSDVVTRGSDQHFKELNIQNSTVLNLEAVIINRINIAEIMRKSIPKNGSLVIVDGNKTFAALGARSINSEGPITGFDVNDIYRRSIPTWNISELTFTGKPVFRDIHLSSLNVAKDEINGRWNLSNFASSNVGLYNGNKWIITGNIGITELLVRRSLNDIPVNNDQLGVFLSNTSRHQSIVGHGLHNLHLKGPTEINGTVNGISLAEWNHTKTIFLNDPNIQGTINTKKVTFAKGVEVTTELNHESRDVLRTLNLLIPINKPLPCVPNFIHFDSVVGSGNTVVGSINGQSPALDWVVRGLRNTSIKAPKTFLSNVTLAKASKALSLYVSPAQDRDLLRILPVILTNGTDQQFTGHIRFDRFVIVKNLSATSDNDVVLDGILLSNILTTKPDQLIQVNTTLKSRTTIGSKLKVQGNLKADRVNGQNISQLWQDTLRKSSDSPQRIVGHYRFNDTLVITNLKLDGRLGRFLVHDLLATIILNGDNKTLLNSEAGDRINGSLIFSNTAHVEALDFVTSFNGLTPDRWGNLWMTKKGNQQITGPFFFNFLKVDEPATQSNVISGVDMERLKQRIIYKTVGGVLGDTDFNANVTFHGDFCSESINGYNITRDFLRKSVVSPQVVTGKKLFSGNWNVLGNLEARIPHPEQIDWKNLLRFITGQTNSSEKVYVHGNCASFIEPEPPVQFNRRPWRNLTDEIWLSNRNTTIVGPILFDSLHLQGGAIRGLVDGVDLRLLQRQRLSKSKDQRTNGTFVIQSNFCAKELIAGQIVMRNGKLNGLNVERFSQTALRNDEDQTITTKFRIGKLTTPSLTLDGKVNHSDFCKDFVSIRGKNRLSGIKTIHKLSALKLHFRSDFIVNGIDLSTFFQNAARTDSNSTVSGNRSFSKARISRLVIDGSVNGEKINSDGVLRLSGNQVGSGNLTVRHPTNNETTFKNIHVDGKVNGLDLEDFFNSKMVSNGSEPLYFYGPFAFNASVKAAWIQTEGRYKQHDIDVPDFLIDDSVANYMNGTLASDLLDKYHEINNVTERLLHVATEHCVWAASVHERTPLPVPGLRIVKAARIADEPVLAVVASVNGLQSLEIWKVEDVDDMTYNRSEIRPVAINGTVRDIVSFNSGGVDLLFVSATSVSGDPVIFSAFPGGRGLRVPKDVSDKVSKAVLLRLENVPGKKPEFVIEDVFYADDFSGTAVTFAVDTMAGPKGCIVSGISKQYVYSIVLSCIKIHGQGPSENSTKFEPLQSITLNKLPQITSLEVRGKTMVVVSDSGNSSTNKVTRSDVIKIFSFDASTSYLSEEDCFPVMNIVSVDSILAPNYHPFLAVVSGRVRQSNHDGLVYIYKYSEESGRFKKFQTILEDNPLTARFHRVEPSDELFLYIVTRRASGNVAVYTFKGVSGWVKEHSFTIEKAHSVEPTDVVNGSAYKARLVAHGIEMIQIFDWKFKGIPYAPAIAWQP